MKKVYVGIACTTYKTILVEVEYDEFVDNFDDALRSAEQEAQIETGADETEICAYFKEKPVGTNMAMYDDFLETVV